MSTDRESGCVLAFVIGADLGAMGLAAYLWSVDQKTWAMVVALVALLVGLGAASDWVILTSLFESLESLDGDDS